MVVPVPEVITADTANVLEPEVFDRLDAYSQPRLVRYECSDFEVNEDDFSDGGGGTTGGFEEPNAGGVEIEAHFIEGEYEILLYLQLVQRGYIPGSMIIISKYPHKHKIYYRPISIRICILWPPKYRKKALEEFGIESGSALSPLQIRYNSLPFKSP